MNTPQSKHSIENCDPKTHIIIKGARVHNLKNVDVAIPRNQLVVITGLSGSGKSSFFDLILIDIKMVKPCIPRRFDILVQESFI
jgi:ABC-type proline/glycine betaine transport system ATPase subunit